MAKLTTEEFIAAIKELSVLELNDLVKACEEEFGVSAAAGVVVAAAGAAEAAEEKDEFDVELAEVGPNKVKVIKVVREVTGLKKAHPKQKLKISKQNLKLKALRLTLNNYLPIIYRRFASRNATGIPAFFTEPEDYRL